MKLRKVISGGQTGADLTGLEEAKKLKLETGGTVPKGCRTEIGPIPELVSFYGCVEDDSRDYTPRTKKNAADGDATVWFGNLGSPGYWCTRRGCEEANKPFYENPTPKEFKELANTYEVLNIAGNRKSTNKAVVELVRKAFAALR